MNEIIANESMVEAHTVLEGPMVLKAEGVSEGKEGEAAKVFIDSPDVTSPAEPVVN